MLRNDGNSYTNDADGLVPESTHPRFFLPLQAHGEGGGASCM